MSMKPNHTVTAIAAGSAVIYGWWAHGWLGLTLAVCAAAGWVWMQFRQQSRLLKQASEKPAGQVESVVMMQARLAHGMEMTEVVALAGSLGRKFSATDEWQWTDPAGNDIVVTFRRGVLVRWAVAHQEPAASSEPLIPLSELRQPQDPRAQFSALMPSAKTA